MSGCFAYSLVSAIALFGFHPVVADVLAHFKTKMSNSHIHYEHNLIAVTNGSFERHGLPYYFKKLNRKTAHHPLTDHHRLPVVGKLKCTIPGPNHSVAFVGDMIVEPSLPRCIPTTAHNLNFICNGRDFHSFYFAYKMTKCNDKKTK